MTCIVGWLHNNRVTIGGDAAASNAHYVEQRMAPKVFTNGPMVFGFTSSFRMGDLLEHALKVPDRKVNESVDAFMRTSFIDEVRRVLKAGGFAKVENGVETAAQEADAAAAVWVLRQPRRVGVGAAGASSSPPSRSEESRC